MRRAVSKARQLFLAALIAAGLPFAQASAQGESRGDLSAGFRLGLVGGPDETLAARLRSAYSDALGTRVEVRFLRDYPALIEAQASGTVHYGIYTALAYATAAEYCDCLVPLAAPVSVDGALAIRSVLVTRGERVDGPLDLGARRIAVATDDVLSLSFLPLTGFRAIGPGAGIGDGFLVRTATAGEAEALFLAGEADGVFIWEAVGPEGEEHPPSVPERLAATSDHARPVAGWYSAPLRYGPHALLTSVPEEARNRLLRFLTGLAESDPDLYEMLEPIRGGGFAAVSEADYRSAVEAVRSLVALRDER